MLIPEYTTKTGATPQLTPLTSMEEYEKLRQSTTDKLLLILVTAEWDDSSKLLLEMIKEMPNNRVTRKVIANSKPIFRALGCSLRESLLAAIEIKIMLSMPRTSSNAVSVANAIHASGEVIISIFNDF